MAHRLASLGEKKPLINFKTLEHANIILATHDPDTMAYDKKHFVLPIFQFSFSFLIKHLIIPPDNFPWRILYTNIPIFLFLLK